MPQKNNIQVIISLIVSLIYGYNLITNTLKTLEYTSMLGFILLAILLTCIIGVMTYGIVKGIVFLLSRLYDFMKSLG